MSGRAADRGEGNLGCIVWALLLGLAILIAWKLIPVKLASSQLFDYMEESAKYAGHGGNPEEIAKGILAKAAELKLPLDKDHLKVTRHGDNIREEASFTVPVEFPGYTYMWHFEHQFDKPIFIF
ncbi:MAG TPA: hypothetical protein VHR45_16310 [Thermoanaerobaculia bacterium]|nr:hypothetical protein [Thermoanaerobaculia bacterium]